MMKTIGTILISLLVVGPVWSQGEVLTLNDCIGIALKHNSDAKISRYGVESSRQMVKAAYGGGAGSSGILPRISMSAQSGRYEQGKVSYYRDTPVGIDSTTGSLIWKSVKTEQPQFGRNSHNLGLTVSQNIYDGGKWWNSIGLAKNELAISETDYESYTQWLITQVKQLFYEVLKERQLLRAFEKSLESSSEQVKKTRQLLELGSVAETDLLKAQVKEGNDKISVLKQKTSLKLAKANLNIAMGRSADTPFQLSEGSYIKPKSIEPESAFHTALAHNKDLQRLEQELESREYNYKIARGDYFPSLTAQFRYNRDNTDFAKVYTGFDENWSLSLGVGLGLDIFSGFRKKTTVQQRLLSVKIAREKIVGQRREVQKELENYLLALDTYREMIEINELNLRSAEEDLRLAEELYRLKSATFLEILDAQAKLIQAEQSLINARYDAKIAEAQLDLVMGIVEPPE